MAEAQSGAWLSRIQGAARELPDPERLDFMHVAYMNGAKAVLHSLVPDDDPHTAMFQEEERARREVRTHDPFICSRGVEVSAGFNRPDDPVSQYWLIQKTPVNRKSLPLPLTAAGHLSFLARGLDEKIPSFTIQKRGIGEDASPLPQAVTLLDAPASETRAMNRSEADLNTFGHNLQVVARALAFVLPEPQDVFRLALIEN